MIRLKEKEKRNFLMEINTKGNGWISYSMGKDVINLLMETPILVSLSITRGMVKDYISSPMEIFMKGNIKMIKEMGREYLPMLMEQKKLVNTRMENPQENIKFLGEDRVVHLRLIIILLVNWILLLLQANLYDVVNKKKLIKNHTRLSKLKLWLRVYLEFFFLATGAPLWSLDCFLEFIFNHN